MTMININGAARRFLLLASATILLSVASAFDCSGPDDPGFVPAWGTDPEKCTTMEFLVPRAGPEVPGLWMNINVTAHDPPGSESDQDVSKLRVNRTQVADVQAAADADPLGAVVRVGVNYDMRGAAGDEATAALNVNTFNRGTRRIDADVYNRTVVGAPHSANPDFVCVELGPGADMASLRVFNVFRGIVEKRSPGLANYARLDDSRVVEAQVCVH